jgi:hypothetical protein
MHDTAFLSSFAKFEKVTITFIMCVYVCGGGVCPSVHMERLDPYWRDIHEISYLNFLKIPQKNFKFYKIIDKTKVIIHLW